VGEESDPQMKARMNTSLDSINMDKNAELRQQISTHLLQTYGPVIGPEDLWQILSFKSKQAFDRSVQRKVTQLPFFRPAGRDGLFVLAPVLAEHLVQMAANSMLPSNDDEEIQQGDTPSFSTI
jgi:hypothetical protein